MNSAMVQITVLRIFNAMVNKNDFKAKKEYIKQCAYRII